jgi:aminoglycoside N3'-acetyltransferase
VGPVEGGAETILEALLELVGPDGTVMAPVFCPANRLDDILAYDSSLPRPDTPFDPATADPAAVGILAATIAGHPNARRSEHPSLAFAAIGNNAEFLTRNAPFQFPLGTGGPLAKLHQLNGKVLLLGVGHEVNSSIHLAEVWADAPYARRKALVRTGEEKWEEMEGSPECSAGFARIESILRQARILKSGYVGNAASQSMRSQFLVSMVREMLVAQPDFLLCDNPSCPHCSHARKLTRTQDAIGIDR